MLEAEAEGKSWSSTWGTTKWADWKACWSSRWSAGEAWKAKGLNDWALEAEPQKASDGRKEAGATHASEKPLRTATVMVEAARVETETDGGGTKDAARVLRERNANERGRIPHCGAAAG